MELIAASVASGFLLAGLAGVMLIGQQVAYTPAASAHRTEAANVVNQISEELRYATLVIQQNGQTLEFVVADRDSDGAAEKIRYAWSGDAGDPLYKTTNSGSAVAVLDSVESFGVTLEQESTTTTLTTEVDSAELELASNATVISGNDFDITAQTYAAQQVNPSTFASIPANVKYWNATRIIFHGRQEGGDDETLVVQLRRTGDYLATPTSVAVGQVNIPEAALTGSYDWNTAWLSAPARRLSMHRQYAITWGGIGSGKAARFRPDNTASSGVFESLDGGATWQYLNTRQMFYRLYGTYTTPGPSYSVTRNFVTNVQLALRTSQQQHARIDASVPLANAPELLSAHWRADFSANPTSQNANGDAVADWALAGGGALADATLINGVWYASGALETRPLNDFTTNTIVEARCRNTSVGGNGAVVQINADRQGGQYAPLLVYVTRQSDGTQTLQLLGKSSDAVTTQLFARTNLPAEFIRFRLLIVPQSNVVNVSINDEDQGSFTYPTYVPSTTTDRYLTLYADTSLAEFDYIDVRSATN
jgi:hypothetical protein